MRLLHTRTQLQQTQFTKTKKYGLRVMVGLLILALIIGTGQMTAQPTHALAPVVLAPVITAKEVLTVGAFLLYASLKHQQHETARKKLETQCSVPVNENFPLCLPLKDITKPLPLADIQNWLKAQCKKDSACIEKLVQGIEILFKTFTKMPIQLGPTLCTHPNFTLLAETLEQYCKKGGFLSSKLGKPKPGGTSGIGGKTRVSSSANSNSGAGGNGNSEENPYTQRETAYKRIFNQIYGANRDLNGYIRDYERKIKRIQERSEGRGDENLKKKDSEEIADFREKLRRAKERLEKVQKLLAELQSVQAQQRELNLMIKNGTHSVEYRNNLNQKILGEINRIQEKYQEQILQDHKSEVEKRLKNRYPGTNTTDGKKLKSIIKQYIASKTPRDGVYLPDKKRKEMLANKIQAEALWNRIEALQLSLDDEINRMNIVGDKISKEQDIKKLHEDIQLELKRIDAEYQALKGKK